MEKKPIPLTDTGHIIETSCLTKDYGFGRGVFDVNLHVNEGEVFGFLGPNGTAQLVARQSKKYNLIYFTLSVQLYSLNILTPESSLTFPI